MRTAKTRSEDHRANDEQEVDTVTSIVRHGTTLPDTKPDRVVHVPDDWSIEVKRNEMYVYY
jgi:hypothetical protein